PRPLGIAHTLFREWDLGLVSVVRSDAQDPLGGGSCLAVSASAGVPMVVQLSPPRERWPTQVASRRLEAGRNYAVLRAARRKSDQPQPTTAGSRGRAR